MKVIHGGTIVQTVFHVLDDDDNISSSITVGPAKDAPDDPLRVKKLNKEEFSTIYDTLDKIKHDLQDKVETHQSSGGQLPSNCNQNHKCYP